ncbi:hypothetical protein B0H17DRAFT_883738, partial [Mycena rosella]
DAATSAQRANLHAQDDLRYSELLRLPWWDPTCIITIDPMHSFSVGLLASHAHD